MVDNYEPFVNRGFPGMRNKKFVYWTGHKGQFY